MQNGIKNDAPNGVEIGADAPDAVDDLLRGQLGGLERQVLITAAEIQHDHLTEWLAKYGTDTENLDAIEAVDPAER